MRTLLWLLPLLIGLPLLGVALTGQPLAPYLDFPPAAPQQAHAPFSWLVFSATALLIISTLTAMAWLILRSHRRQLAPPLRTSYSLPWWGYVAAAVWLLSWLLSWSRFDGFSDLQYYTFAPLWISFILLLNGLTYQRTGRCLLIDRLAYFGRLFVISGLFWWYFELLNRLVQNWYYLGLDPDGITIGQVHLDGSALYVTSATIAFSTVLPGVISMKEFLASFRLLGTVGNGPCFPINQRLVARIFIAVAMVALLLIGVFPDALFAMVWITPLLLIVGIQLWHGENNLLTACGKGQWHQLWLPMLAALACGLCWEMWNSQSQAVWHYALPFVDRFHLFEMPILGYGGYLPFGLECAAVAQLVRR